MKSFRSRQIQGKLGARFAIVKTRGLVPANVITAEELNVVSDTDRPLPLLGSLPAKEPREGKKRGELLLLPDFVCICVIVLMF